MSDLPGGAISSRPLRFYWVLDVSGSMWGAKIRALNHAVREALPAMRQAAADNPGARVEVRVLTFGTGVRWLTAAPVPLGDFTWSDVGVDGLTDMGAALQALAVELSIHNMPDRALPPVVVLVSDGQPTDDFDGGLRALMDEPWGSKAVRIAVAIGDADHGVLCRFVGDPAIEVLTARNPQDLVAYVRWASTEVLRAASAPAGGQGATTTVTASMVTHTVRPPAGDPAAEVVW